MKNFFKLVSVDIITSVLFIAALIYLAVMSPVPFIEWHKSIENLFLGWLVNLSAVIILIIPIGYFSMRMKQIWYKCKKKEE